MIILYLIIVTNTRIFPTNPVEQIIPIKDGRITVSAVLMRWFSFLILHDLLSRSLVLFQEVI